MGSLDGGGDRMVAAEQQLQNHHHHHFLLVSFPIVSHVNPVLHLAKLLTRSGVRVTFSTAVSHHRRMFADTPELYPLPDPRDPLLTYHPYSDGYDDGFDRAKDDSKDYMATQRTVGGESLYSIAATAVPPVTCVIYAIILPWVASVAAKAGVPSACFWIQPATVFSIYYHYFHGHGDLIAAHSGDPSFVVNMPDVPPVQVRDLPSFLTPRSDADDNFDLILLEFEELYRTLDRGSVGKKTNKVLVNSFDSLEQVNTLAAASKLELIPIGPVLPPAILGGCDRSDDISCGKKDLTTKTVEAKDDYTEWLRRWPEKSVVYISFGSLSPISKKQKEEISKTVRDIRRPYLWVARDGKEGVEVAEDDEMGMVVDWCTQVEVLSQASVGCFVTHCGWNSTLESLASGVPMVCYPQWTDQRTNAWLVEEVWGVGVRAPVSEEGVMEAGDLTRCLNFVMGEDGVEIRKKAQMWQEKAREAVKEGGSSDVNLKKFLKNLEN